MKKNLSCEWKKRLEHWSCFCSQVQFSIWCCILKLTKWLNIERAQYCLISNASVFLENLRKPEPLGGALFYSNSSKFLFSNPPGLALFHIACKKFSIWSQNQFFWVRLRNFFKEWSSSVDQADPGLQTEPNDIFDFFSTFLPRNAQIWLKTRFLDLKTTVVDLKMPWN